MKIKFYIFFLLCLFALNYGIYAHEGHHPVSAIEETGVQMSSHAIIHWLGSFHYLFLHFPIALIIMTAIAELLFLRSGDPLYREAAHFMLAAGAVMAIPTALLGWALSEGSLYQPPFETFFWWHRFFGIFTALWAILTITVREVRYGIAYAGCLTVLVISVFLTGFFGGNLAFGAQNFIPPFFK